MQTRASSHLAKPHVPKFYVVGRDLQHLVITLHALFVKGKQHHGSPASISGDSWKAVFEGQE